MSVVSPAARRTAWPHRPPPIDLAIASVFVVLVVVEALVGGGPRPLWIHLPVATVAMAALAWRRQFPLVVALLVVAANLVITPTASSRRCCRSCWSATRWAPTPDRPGTTSAPACW